MKNSIGKHPNPYEPEGAVLVVGGGIAGMQASLDLADQGFKVYLTEIKSAIGGKMAQLDKTFPTNDCAMCTISPKLVETGRHPNIEILTQTEVVDVQGTAGRFSARLRHLPRYIDTEKCVACNDCVEVCPVVVQDHFNEGLNERRAVYKLYPQAVPNAYAIEKRGIAPCRDACPAGQRAQGYIALIREGRWEEALRVIKMDNPFPGICGRICNHRCEEACNRGLVDEPINIRALKRFVTDTVYAGPRIPLEPVPVTRPERVAIIGAGPCGLTAAQDLARAGFAVTIFEAMPVAGGMLRLGVPEYRLPTEIIEREVQDILDLGVELKLNHYVENLDSLFEAGFEAVLIAVGAHEGVRLPIPGADLEGVLINTHFLRDVRLGKYQNGAADVHPLGKRIMVLGGGNVAIDCARSAIRLGREVHLACLEDLDQMPAHPWEVEAAIAEGVQIHPGRSFEQILSTAEGKVAGVECQHVSDFRFDPRGGLHVEKVPNSHHSIPCDTVIFSVGQRAGLAFIPPDAGVGITGQSTIAINPNTLAATRPGVYAAGDSISGTAFVIEAVASGHKAAQSIERYLRGLPLEPPPSPELPVVHFSSQEIEQKMAQGIIRKSDRVPLPELSVDRRLRSFAEIELGYDERAAQAEADRCLACGICSECMCCVFACGRNAIDHDMVAWEEEISVGAVILAPGYQVYRAELSEEYGYGRFPNVVTALQFERLLSASGPTQGHVRRPSDEKAPRRIAFLQCVGSRDQSHNYCSAVCCMYATKEAIMAKEHDPDLDIHVFMMDMRAFSKGYWDYFQRARDRYGVRYHRCRASSLQQTPGSHDLALQYIDEEGNLQQQTFDMAVLSVGMEISEPVRALGRRLGTELDDYGFCHTVQFNPVETSRKGIFAVGPFREPKDIPESVVEASSAAASAAADLSTARFRRTEERTYPPEIDQTGAEPRIGVFVCHCGSNIGGYLDVPAVTEFAKGLPFVVRAEANLYTCSQDSIKHITETVKELGLNRVVVASCTPLTHQPLFQDSIRAAGLNPYLFEMANIRNQCSWVHSSDWDVATEKAHDLVRMAVARAAHLEPQQIIQVPVEKSALIIGGGVAGMTAALNLAEQGFPVSLVEKENALGGNLRHVHIADNHRDPQRTLETLVGRVDRQPLISTYLDTVVSHSAGFMGNFTTKLRRSTGETMQVKHGVTIIATGGQEYRGADYSLGKNAQVITQSELEALFKQPASPLDSCKAVGMVLCIGPAQQYCSRICCTVALKNALAIKQRSPSTAVTIFYKDIRVYGMGEDLYTKAREAGVLFIRYTEERPPQVVQDSPLFVRAFDLSLRQEVELPLDMLVLSMPVVPREDSAQLASLVKAPLDANGFFLEAHVKLRPVDTNKGGVFIAGMAHYPKLLEESMIQAQAAASRAARVLSKDHLAAGGQVAVVDPDRCTGCLTCLRICPFDVPVIRAELAGIGGIMGAAYIEAAICQGCGNCVSECPAQAIQLMHYSDRQIEAKIEALVRADPPLIRTEQIVEAGGI